MKRFLSLFIILACMASFTACGAIGNKPDIDEGLHIAADDAEQRLDRLENENDGPVVFDPPKGEQPSNADPEPGNPESEESYPEPDFTEPEPWPPANTPSRGDFWLDENTYNLISYAEALGCVIKYKFENDPSEPEKIDYCGLDFYSGRADDGRCVSIYSTSNKANKTIFTCSTGWQVVGGDYDSDINGYLDGNIIISDPSSADMVYIQNHNFWMPRPHLEATLTILDRFAANDPECWFRGLGINHVGQSRHDD